jgi:hypothetical protein
MSTLLFAMLHVDMVICRCRVLLLPPLVTMVYVTPIRT